MVQVILGPADLVLKEECGLFLSEKSARIMKLAFISI